MVGIIIAIVVLAVLTGGYFWWSKSQSYRAEWLRTLMPGTGRHTDECAFSM